MEAKDKTAASGQAFTQLDRRKTSAQQLKEDIKNTRAQVKALRDFLRSWRSGAGAN